MLKKRRKCPDVDNKAAFEMAEEEALCEESSGNEEDFSKAGPPAILSVFHSDLKQGGSVFGASNLPESIKCDLCPKRYLAFSVLRI